MFFTRQGEISDRPINYASGEFAADRSGPLEPGTPMYLVADVKEAKKEVETALSRAINSACFAGLFVTLSAIAEDIY